MSENENASRKASSSRFADRELQERKLGLIMAIDHIRDSVVEPSAMLSAIANVLADHFQAELCLLCLLDRETSDLELKSIIDRGKWLGQFEPIITRELAKRVVDADGAAMWTENEVLPESVLSQLPDGVHLIATPIILGANTRLGALLLARSQVPFGTQDVELLRVAESQIDSAVVQGYAYYDLQQRNKELETIYKIDRIRDQHPPFDEMLNMVLQELRAVIEAEMGFVMLYNRTGHRLELRATTHDDLFRMSPHHEMVEQTANDALRQATVISRNDLDGMVRSILCIPLILNDEIIGVLGVANRYGPHGFKSEDRRLLSAIGSQMDTAIFEGLEQRRLRQVLGRSVDPQVMKRLLANPDVEFLKGERSELSVLYADLRDSTGLAERTAPELLVEFINDYLGQMTEIILSHQATLDKFVGDEVMALFGAPFPQPDHALRAVRVGLEMQAAHQRIMETWLARDIEPAAMGIGIATGEMTVGEMGCPQRTDYTIIGRAANLGARICGVAKPDQVLISQATYDLIKDQVAATPIPGLHFKGVDSDVTVYHVSRILA